MNRIHVILDSGIQFIAEKLASNASIRQVAKAPRPPQWAAVIKNWMRPDIVYHQAQA